MKKDRILSKYVKEVFECKSEFSDFFGYYNYDTLNYNQTRLLAHRIPFCHTTIDKTDIAEVGYYEIADGSWHKVAETDSFNWDQGSMLQWLPGRGNENKIVFNVSRNGHLCSKICDIETLEIKDIDWSIYGLTPDGKKSIALEMERSYWCRAYHYNSVANLEHDGLIDASDGIFEIDLESNTRKRIIAIQDIVAMDSTPEFSNMKHWLEHIMISPDGTKFVFLHRFAYPDNVFRYITRMFIANIDGSNLQVVPGWQNYRWSHFGWNGNNAFAIYAYKSLPLLSLYTKSTTIISEKKQKLTYRHILNKVLHLVSKILPQCLKKLLKGRDSFYQYYCSDDNGLFKECSTLNQKVFDIDGHESFTNDGRYMITDSYPDSKGYRRLIIFDTQSKKAKIVAKYLEGRKCDTETRVDLHPKLCINNDFVVIDSNCTGKPHLIVIKINWTKVKDELK